MKNKKYFLFVFILIFISAFSFSQTNGEKLFKSNHPKEAAAELEKEISTGKNSIDAYNYLGLAYFQAGEYKKSVEAFARGLKVSGTNKKILSFNQGNSYYAMGDYNSAIQCYSLTISADPFYNQALLNRANAYLMAQKYDECIVDYEKYITVEPNDPQRPQIEEILALLRKKKQELAEQERKAKEEAERLAEEERLFAQELERQAEEERKAKEAERLRLEQEAEQRRLEEEKRLAEEEERKRKLLEEVANSLQTDSENMSSGAEDIIDYDYESELD